jgi:hypothetical protein
MDGDTPGPRYATTGEATAALSIKIARAEFSGARNAENARFITYLRLRTRSICDFPALFDWKARRNIAGWRKCAPRQLRLTESYYDGKRQHKVESFRNEDATYYRMRASQTPPKLSVSPV